MDFKWALLMTSLAGLATAAGGAIALVKKEISDRQMAALLAFSGGVMLYLSFMEMMPEAIGYMSSYAQSAQGTTAVMMMFAGIGLMAIFDRVLPNPTILDTTEEKDKKTVLRAGLIMAFGMLIHNIPEGMAAFMASAYDRQTGLMMALAIALHNIPEGIAISSSIYYASANRKKAFGYAFLSGIAEPVGGLVAYWLMGAYLNVYTMSLIYALAAGIMIYISLEELFPLAQQYAKGDKHLIFWATIGGMAVMAFVGLIGH